MARVDSPGSSPGRRAFCCQACAAAALAVLGPALFGQAPPGSAPADGPFVTGETRTGMPAGSARDYRKQGGFFLLADGAGVYAVTAVCTHMGCKVRLVAGQGFSCPCHDSGYDLLGNVTQGPAKRALKHLAVAEQSPGGPLVVDLGQEVDPHVRL